MGRAEYHRSGWLATLLLVMSIAAVLRPSAGRALESTPPSSGRARVTLVSEAESYVPGKPFRLGLRFRMDPGWHIYWQNPGDAGVPPELTLDLPEGAKASGIAWPAPLRMPEGPVMTYGYTGELVLPVTVTPPPGNAAIPVKATASWLVCEKICIPEEGSFQLYVPAGDGAPSPLAHLFAAADNRIPRPSPFAAKTGPDGTLSLEGQGLSSGSVKEAWFFPAAWGAIAQDAPQPFSVEDGRLALALKPGPEFASANALAGVIALKDAGGNETFLQISAPRVPAIPGVGDADQMGDADQTGLSPARALLFAFLGGLILNLMPCVFPVLAMKALSLAKLSGGARGVVRRQALAYVAGVLVAFCALGGLLLGLRGAGTASGWGFQFHSPIFVGAMAWLFFVIGLNLSGVFEVGGRLAGAGQSLAGRSGAAGSFFTGLLAAVVATPCTAPFMAAALAAAVTAPLPLAFGIFAALGVGLGAPYGLLALAPGFAARMPRPGRWMDVAKQALAFPMYGAAAWLVWVLSQQAGPDGVLTIGLGLLLLGFAGWSLGQAQRTEGSWRWVGRGGALLAVAAVLALASALQEAGPQQASAAGPAAGEPFSRARLDALRAEGHPVFVDMTAAWCVTCLVNERIALSPKPVRDAFAARGVVYMKGDWTRYDPAITAFLREHGRDGVPLYVLYPPKGDPTVLPQILTEAAVLDELKQLGS